MTDDVEIIMSPLYRTFEEEGLSFQVEIYRSHHSDWTLEVINPSSTSIVWQDTFSTDGAALAEFHRTVREEGIAVLLD